MDAWTIHPANHSPEFIDSLPRLLSLIEQGKFPEAQAGYYDLKLDSWQDMLDD